MIRHSLVEIEKVIELSPEQRKVIRKELAGYALSALMDSSVASQAEAIYQSETDQDERCPTN